MWEIMQTQRKRHKMRIKNRSWILICIEPAFSFIDNTFLYKNQYSMFFQRIVPWDLKNSLGHLGEIAEDLVALGVEDHKALIKVVVLHGGGGVQGGQAVARLDLQGRVHCKKCYSFSRIQQGCQKPNSPWIGIIKLFLSRESLVCDIPARDGKI